MRAPRVQCEQAKNRGWRSGSRLGHVIGMIARLKVTSGHLIGCLGKRCVPTFHAVQRPLASLGLPPWANWDPLLGIRGLLHRSESFLVLANNITQIPSLPLGEAHLLSASILSFPCSNSSSNNLRLHLQCSALWSHLPIPVPGRLAPVSLFPLHWPV